MIEDHYAWQRWSGGGDKEKVQDEKKTEWASDYGSLA
jgi:hypothetical protein